MPEFTGFAVFGLSCFGRFCILVIRCFEFVCCLLVCGFVNFGIVDLM